MDDKVETSETTISYETDRADHQKPVTEKPVTMEPVSGLGLRGEGDRHPLPWMDPQTGDVEQREALVDGGTK